MDGEQAQPTEVGGVDAPLSRGLSGSTSIQHSKTLLRDDHPVVGSCSWTSSSRLNQTLSALLTLDQGGIDAYDEKLGYTKRQSTPFTPELAAAGTARREARGKSAPPAEMISSASSRCSDG